MHSNKYVMRDFRLPNVLTRAGQEGDYVVVDLEYAGPDGAVWTPTFPLADWDENTFTMVRKSAICSCAFCLCWFAVWSFKDKLIAC